MKLSHKLFIISAIASFLFASCNNSSKEEKDYSSEPTTIVVKAAEQGDAEAQYCLGVCYENGQGVEQDSVEAATWYKLAADQGLAEAQEALEKLGTNE